MVYKNPIDRDRVYWNKGVQEWYRALSKNEVALHSDPIIHSNRNFYKMATEC